MRIDLFFSDKLCCILCLQIRNSFIVLLVGRRGGVGNSDGDIVFCFMFGACMSVYMYVCACVYFTHYAIYKWLNSLDSTFIVIILPISLCSKSLDCDRLCLRCHDTISTVIMYHRLTLN